jgi:outer membrane protein OmpA-like peptidoglycan-associated protein
MRSTILFSLLVATGCASSSAERVHPEMAKADCMQDSQCGDKKLCVSQQCVPVQAAQVACSTPLEVAFASNSAEFTTRELPQLDRIARCLRGDHQLRVRITGTADVIGTRQDNLALAGARSIAVAEYLKSQGVSSDQLRLADYGEDKPVCPTIDEECLKKNRRALLDVERVPGRM